MYIIGLVKSPEHVCCRYRLAAFQPFLERAGHRLELWPLADVVSWPFGNFGKLDKADVVILQRKLLPGGQLSRLRKSARHLVFDFDDAVFMRDSYASGGLHDDRLLRRFVRTMKTVDAVVAGNSYLAEQAACSASPARIHVIPTALAPARYRLSQHQQRETVKMVWIGSSRTLRGMAQVRALLDELGRRIPSLRLKIICDRSLQLEHLPVEFAPWSTETEADELADADIGISWVPDDDWSRGKCGLKVLQYMAAGLPVVANPVGIQAELVQHGTTGMLAHGPEAWRQAVLQLAQSADLRRRLGSMGRQVVQTYFDQARAADSWLALFGRLDNSPEAGVRTPNRWRG